MMVVLSDFEKYPIELALAFGITPKMFQQYANDSHT